MLDTVKVVKIPAKEILVAHSFVWNTDNPSSLVLLALALDVHVETNLEFTPMFLAT